MDDIKVAKKSKSPNRSDDILIVNNIEVVYSHVILVLKGVSLKVKKGSITALAGYGDNYSEFQTDAALNQGNSGGPIMNQKGNIVGIAVASWVQEGVQGVHFGIKSSTLKTFANSNSLKFSQPNNKELTNKRYLS